jgi:hypothetical protein
MARERFRLLAAMAVGFGIGAAAGMLRTGDGRSAWAQETTPPEESAELDTLRADVEMLKGKAPDQAHAMQDVGYHFANLWFAGQARNWPLAAFYNQEVLSHLKWAVRIIPVRKDNAGQDVKLGEILEAFENAPWTQLNDAIGAEDSAAFDRAYRFALESCYACHKASDKPFIRPQMPEQPETPIINFDPAAQWPR